MGGPPVFRSRDTLLSSLPVAAGDTPGFPAGTRFLNNGEEATAQIFNRSLNALAENTDVLNDDIDTLASEVTAFEQLDLAVPEVGVLASFSGAAIEIDPSGGAAGDINYSGTLYLGESGWSGQEKIDTLFQLVDENYNEVLVDGEEVKVTSLSGNALGDGFVSTLTTLNLNATLPSGNYRLSYGRGRQLQSLPAYSFMVAGIRGLEELPGESARRSVYVLDAAGSAAADFSGSTALQDALASLKGGAGNIALFLRAGTYEAPAGSDFTIAAPDVQIIGEGTSATTGTVINIPAGYSLVLNGEGVSLQSVRVAVSGTQTGGESIEVRDSNIQLINVVAASMQLQLVGSASQFYGRQITCGGYDQGLVLTSGIRHSIENIRVLPSSNPSGSLITIGNTSSGVIKNCSAGSTSIAQNCVEIGTSCAWSFQYGYFSANASTLYIPAAMDGYANTFRSSFSNCTFHSLDGLAFEASDVFFMDFYNCNFRSRASVLSIGSTNYGSAVSFTDCIFQNYATITGWYKTPFVDVRGPAVFGEPSGKPCFTNCQFHDVFCQGNDSPSDPGTVTPDPITTRFPVISLSGVVGQNIVFDRTGLTYFVGNSSWVRFTGCVIDGFRVNTGTPTAAYHFDATYPNGMIEVLSGSTITNLYVGTRFPGLWYIPVLYQLSISGVCTVSNFNLDATHADNWSTVDGVGWELHTSKRGLLAKLASNAILDSFTFVGGFRYGVGASQTDSLIHFSGLRNIFRNSFIQLGAQKGLSLSIMYDGGNGTRIMNNKISCETDNASFYGVLNLVVLVGSGSWVQNNILYRAQDNPAIAMNQHIIRAPASKWAHISDNILINYGVIESPTDETVFISCDEENFVSNNMLYESNETHFATPTIDPVTVWGYATNVMQGSSDPPPSI